MLQFTTKTTWNQNVENFASTLFTGSTQTSQIEELRQLTQNATGNITENFHSLIQESNFRKRLREVNDLEPLLQIKAMTFTTLHQHESKELQQKLAAIHASIENNFSEAKELVDALKNTTNTHEAEKHSSHCINAAYHTDSFTTTNTARDRYLHIYATGDFILGSEQVINPNSTKTCVISIND
jgi:hypothetical protein